MKAFNKIKSLFVLCLLLGFVACQEEKPEWKPVDPPGPTQGVFFPAGNPPAVIEMEPPAEFTVTISRNNKAGAVEVPITVLKNEGNIFVVPNKVSFADGEETTQFKVSFPTAQPKVPYQLTLEVQGDQYVDIYGLTNTTFSTNVTLIKWNLFAKGTWISEFWDDEDGEPSEWPMELYKCEGDDEYRLYDVWNDGCDIRFRWDGESKQITPVAPGVAYTVSSRAVWGFPTGVNYNDGGTPRIITFFIDPRIEVTGEAGTYFDLENKIMVLSGYYGIIRPTGFAGWGFGWTEIFSISELL